MKERISGKLGNKNIYYPLFWIDVDREGDFMRSESNNKKSI